MLEADIVEAVRAGDSAIYSRLVEKYQRLVFSIVRKVVKETTEAEELAQDVFVTAFNKIETLKEPGKFKPWLCRIALNIALNNYNRKKPVLISLQYVDEQANETVVNDALSLLESESRRQLIQQTLKALHPEDRILLEFYYLEELSIEEIAEITRHSTNNVKVKLHRIKKRLISTIGKIKNL